MAKLIFGDRISATGKLATGCSGILFDEGRERILLTRRADNGRWCLPGGRMEVGESTTEACTREFWEETGLKVRTLRLIGVYSDPHMVTEYADGNRWQYVSLSFEVEKIDGELGLSDETTEVGYFTPKEIDALDLIESHRIRIKDVLANQVATFIR